MDADTLAREASAGREPPGLCPELRVLWLDATGDWEAAHDLAQDLPDPAGAHLHAYLHRVEGDLPNARYWYQRAGEPTCTDTLAEEWQQLVTRFTVR